MSYRQLERAGGAIQELFRFTRGSATVARYTSGETGRRLGDEDFVPATIHREAISASDERTGTAIRVTVSKDDPLVTAFKGAAPSEPMWLTIIAVHRGSENAASVFYGQVEGVSFEGASAILNCEPAQRVLEQRVPRYLVQKICNHTLYDTSCSVLKTSFSLAGTVGSISADGKTITVSTITQANGWFAAGFLEFGVQREFIEGQTGTSVTLLAAVPGLIVGSSITLYAGCDRLRDTCLTKFANLANFGGFPYVPNENPFDTSLV